MNKADFIGSKWGRLTVLEFLERKKTMYFYRCRCECGREIIALKGHLTTGHTRSCGCLQPEATSKAARTHGRSRTPEYGVWKQMRLRCQSPTHKFYSYYGGRGIKVCDRWQTFEFFFTDMGPRPFPDATLERIDGNGNYEPGNVRWATRKEQSQNIRTNHNLTYQGETFSLTEWANRLGLNPKTLEQRLKRGWTVEKALSTPTLSQGRRRQ